MPTDHTPPTVNHPRPTPAYLTVGLSGLGSVNVTVTRSGPGVIARLAGSDCAVMLFDHPRHLRQVLDDALAQLDAVEAGW